MGRLTRVICSFWEVSDNLPEGRITAVVGMSLPQLKGGGYGKIMARVVSGVVDAIDSRQTNLAIFSNRWPVNDEGKSLAELEKELAVILGVREEDILLPKNPRDPEIRNTRKEAEFALEQVLMIKSQYGQPEILVVANHLHMRRVLATYKIAVSDYPVTIRWRSVGGLEDYAPGYSQSRFNHPLLFLCYEIAALAFSKIKGWA